MDRQKIASKFHFPFSENRQREPHESTAQKFLFECQNSLIISLKRSNTAWINFVQTLYSVIRVPQENAAQ